MLYGAPLYKQRRVIWNLPNPMPLAPEAKPATDAAAPGTGVPDGGVGDGVAAPEAR
jgi:hypothetical protein